MTPMELTDTMQLTLQHPTNPQNEEVLMGLFIGQLPRSVTAARVRNLLITLSNVLKFPLRLYHVDIHQRSGSCAFATVNQSAAYIIVRLDKSFAIDATSLWLAENEHQRTMLSAYLAHQTAVPRKPIVLELRTTAGGPGAPSNMTMNASPLMPSFQPQQAGTANNSMFVVMPQGPQPPPAPALMNYAQARDTSAASAVMIQQGGCCTPACRYEFSPVPPDCLLHCSCCKAQVVQGAWICPSCFFTKCRRCQENPVVIM